MTERRKVEETSRRTALVRPAPSLAWTLDPATGKPIARWTVERPEMIEHFALQAAA